MKKPKVKLNDGTSIPLEVFVTWSAFKQNLMTISVERKKEWYKKIVKNRTRAVNTPYGKFESISEAANSIGIPYSRIRKFLLSQEFPDYNLVNPTSKDVIPLKKEKTLEELDAMRIRRGMAHRRAVNTPIGQFSTVNEAVKALGITKDGLRNLILNTAYPKYSYVNPTQKDIDKQFHRVYKGGPKKTVTPIGTFATKGHAAKALGISYEDLNRLIKSQPKKYYYSEDTLNIGSRKANDPSLYHSTKGYRLQKVFMTPTGTFPSKIQACKTYGLSVIEMDVLMKHHPKDFYKIIK
jgi:hypothetical protein